MSKSKSTVVIWRNYQDDSLWGVDVMEEMCQACKNEDSRRIRDPLEAGYRPPPYKAFHCHCCGATWNFLPPETTNDQT